MKQRLFPQPAQRKHAVLKAEVHAKALQKLRNRSAHSMVLLPARFTC